MSDFQVNPRDLQRLPVRMAIFQNAPEIYNRGVILNRLYAIKEEFFNKEKEFSLHMLSVRSSF
jgi:hypothetical protein